MSQDGRESKEFAREEVQGGSKASQRKIACNVLSECI
jgi:hypothetical protein